MSPTRLNLIRYLIVLRINAPMVWLAVHPSLEFSLVLGTLISETLPTVQARPWRKAMAAWDRYGGLKAMKNKSIRSIPNVSWPIECIFLCYPPMKKAYGEGEKLLVELKLLGTGADHALFLEVILPALEAAGRTADSQWQASNSLWGKFDVHSIFVARGPAWEPLVDEGRLDLHYKPTPTQWSEGLDFCPFTGKQFQRLQWFTGFDFRPVPENPEDDTVVERIPPREIPSVRDILEAFLMRMNSIQTGKRERGIYFLDLLAEEDRVTFERILETASGVHVRYNKLKATAKTRPGRWIGGQQFSPIPPEVLPYLSTAAIFHVGEYTHFGCGTFFLH